MVFYLVGREVVVYISWSIDRARDIFNSEAVNHSIILGRYRIITYNYSFLINQLVSLYSIKYVDSAGSKPWHQAGRHY